MNMLRTDFITKIIKNSMGAVSVPSSVLCLTFYLQFFTWFPVHTLVENRSKLPSINALSRFGETYRLFDIFLGSGLTLNAAENCSLE